MEVNENKVEIDVESDYKKKPSPILVTNHCDLEDILGDAIEETGCNFDKVISHIYEEDNFNSEPEGHNIPEGLDLYNIINEIDSDPETKMEEVNSAAADSGKQNSCRLVGGSKFYEVQMDGPSGDATPSPTEKQDHMKPIESDEEVSDVDQECTMFSGVCYLGAQNIMDPKSEADIQRIIKELSALPESRSGIAVALSVPVCSQGLVVLYQASTHSVMARYAVNRILFYARGAAGTPVASCFAFTWSHGETRESAVHRCHVFRCQIAEAVTQVSSCFAKAFERIPRSMASSLIGDLSAAPSMTGSLTDASCGFATLPMQLMHVLECTVDIKETDAKGTFSQVPKERLGFKLRGGIDKQVTITVQQVNNNAQLVSDDPQAPYTGGLYIERCFGILLAPGRSVKHSDMRLLEMVSGSSGGSNCSVCALWNAGESALAAFNLMTGDGAPGYMSLALDLVIRGIPDPLRLVIETPVKIFPPTERFWYYSKRPLVQQFFVNLKESVDPTGVLQFEVMSTETSGELDRSRLNLPLSLSSLLPSPLSAAPAPPSPSEPDSDGDEPLLSGTGEVSKDCEEDVLVNWAQVLRSWTGQRPRALTQLVRLGVPEALRGEVWLRLADVDQNDKLMETYRTLISKECPDEAVIQRDIARTFPAHEFFRESGGVGQDSLQRMARAYAVHDAEVGYCQGLSFLAATLLLHMPEEQAFCLLVRLMFGYKLRELYKDGFEALYMRLHQLDCLMEEQLPDLRAHFQELGVEPHMFASQWFLTLFTARFPLPLVYHVLDVFLLQGIDTLFQIAIALLSRSRKDLLQHDFEGVLKYFRVTLPKKCRAEDAARQTVKLACSVKVKRLARYQQDYEKLVKESTDSEKEKINVELEMVKMTNAQLQQDKETLEEQVKELRASLEEARKQCARHEEVARNYRAICARLDRQVHQMQENIQGCVSCTAKQVQKDNKEASASEAEAGGGGGGASASVAEADLRQRVRDLELELAQVKLAHVQAQCSNQELNHRLNAAYNEIQTAQKQAETPWLVRRLGSLMDASRPTFQAYVPSEQPLSRHGSLPHAPPPGAGRERRSSDRTPELRRKSDINTAKRHSMLADATPSQQAKELNRRSHDVAILKNISTG